MGYIKVDALLDRVTCLVAPAVDNLEHTIVEHFTGEYCGQVKAVTNHKS